MALNAPSYENEIPDLEPLEDPRLRIEPGTLNTPVKGTFEELPSMNTTQIIFDCTLTIKRCQEMTDLVNDITTTVQKSLTTSKLPAKDAPPAVTERTGKMSNEAVNEMYKKLEEIKFPEGVTVPITKEDVEGKENELRFRAVTESLVKQSVNYSTIMINEVEKLKTSLTRLHKLIHSADE